MRKCSKLKTQAMIGGIIIDHSCPDCGHRAGSHCIDTDECDICKIIEAIQRTYEL